MRIKKLTAAILICVLLALNLTVGVCFAAEANTEAPVTASDEADTGEPAEMETAPETEKSEEDTSDTPDNVTMSGTFSLPFDSMEELEQALSDAAGDGDKEEVTTGKVNVSGGSYLHLRTGAGMDYDIIGHLFTGDELEIVSEDGDWYQVVVKERTGYVHKDYVDVIKQAASDGKTDSDMMAMLLYLMMAGQTGTEKPSVALTPDGNLSLVDDYTEKHADGSGKQFITVTTKDGNYFYLVIDRDKDGNENVHFMNLVDEADLLALMDEEEAAKYTAPVEPEKPAETEPADPEGDEAGDGQKEEPEKKPGTNMMPILILVVALIGGGGFFAFTKLKGQKKKKEQEKPDPDADYVDGEEDDFDVPDDVDEAAEDDDDDTAFDAEDNEPV